MDQDDMGKVTIMLMVLAMVGVLFWVILDEDREVKTLKADAVALGHARWVTGKGGDPEFSWVTNRRQ